VIAAHAAMAAMRSPLRKISTRAQVKRTSTSLRAEAMRDAVIVVADFDVIIDADAADAPLGQDVRIGWQGLQGRPVDLFQKPFARDTQPPDRPLFVSCCSSSQSPH